MIEKLPKEIIVLWNHGVFQIPLKNTCEASINTAKNKQ
jgi:hypothetical protein